MPFIKLLSLIKILFNEQNIFNLIIQYIGSVKQTMENFTNGTNETAKSLFIKHKSHIPSSIVSLILVGISTYLLCTNIIHWIRIQQSKTKSLSTPTEGRKKGFCH